MKLSHDIVDAKVHNSREDLFWVWWT